MFLATAAEMRTIDRKAVESGIPAILLMENAGLAVAREARSFLDDRGSVAVLVGPGQNGGDGLCAARHLASQGFQVTVALFGIPDKMPDEARTNLDMLRRYPVEVLRLGEGQVLFDEAAARMSTANVIIDALLGTGQKGDPRPPLDEAVKWANESGVPIVACDVPTGVDADTGYPFNPAIGAQVTVTMGVPKVGLYVYPGAKYAGRVVTESLGLSPDLLVGPFAAETVGISECRSLMPGREADHHKGMSGHVLVIAGSKGMAGAAVLTSKSVLRAGAGTVTLLCPGDIYEVCAQMAPEVMVLPCGAGEVFAPTDDSLNLVRSFLVKSECVAVGPGFGRGRAQEEFLGRCLPLIAASGAPCVLDADGIWGLRGLGGLSYLAGVEGKFILTPHPGELANLMNVNTPDLERDRVGKAKEAALRGKSVVCLKGAGTCVANFVGSTTVNTSGDPAMATAGSGDVLTGVIAALVSQGLRMVDAARLGVFWHGLSGQIARDKIGSYGVLAGDIVDFLPRARRLIEGGERPA